MNLAEPGSVTAKHIFVGFKQMSGKLMRTIDQTRANFAMTMMTDSYNFKRLVYLKQTGIAAAAGRIFKLMVDTRYMDAAGDVTLIEQWSS